jgi:hypothetical protein
VSAVLTWSVQVKDDAEDKERKKREKEEKEAMKVLLRDQRRRIRNKCEEFDMNRSQTEDLSLALPLEQVKQRASNFICNLKLRPSIFSCCSYAPVVFLY